MDHLDIISLEEAVKKNDIDYLDSLKDIDSYSPSALNMAVDSNNMPVLSYLIEKRNCNINKKAFHRNFSNSKYAEVNEAQNMLGLSQPPAYLIE
eukprot:gene18838-24623_t